MEDQGQGHAAAHTVEAYVLTAEELERVLRHERALSDRSGEPFALLRFELGPHPDRARVAALLAAAMQRVRATDVFGWLQGGELGVLLRYTSVEDALRVAQAIRTLAAAATGEFPCTVHGHPPFRRGESRAPASPSSLTLHVAGQPDPA